MRRWPRRTSSDWSSHALSRAPRLKPSVRSLVPAVALARLRICVVGPLDVLVGLRGVLAVLVGLASLVRGVAVIRALESDRVWIDGAVISQAWTVRIVPGVLLPEIGGCELTGHAPAIRIVGEIAGLPHDLAVVQGLILESGISIWRRMLDNPPTPLGRRLVLTHLKN